MLRWWNIFIPCGVRALCMHRHTHTINASMCVCMCVYHAKFAKCAVQREKEKRMRIHSAWFQPLHTYKCYKSKYTNRYEFRRVAALSLIKAFYCFWVSVSSSLQFRFIWKWNSYEFVTIKKYTNIMCPCFTTHRMHGLRALEESIPRIGSSPNTNVAYNKYMKRSKTLALNSPKRQNHIPPFHSVLTYRVFNACFIPYAMNHYHTHTLPLSSFSLFCIKQRICC